MNRVKVASTSLASVGFDEELRIMHVEFVRSSGSELTVYEYRENGPTADLKAAYEMMMAPGASIGTVYHKHVRTNPDVVCSKVEDPER